MCEPHFPAFDRLRSTCKSVRRLAEALQSVFSEMTSLTSRTACRRPGVDERAGCQTDPEPARLGGNRLDQGLDCFGGYMRSEEEKLNADALNTLRFDWRLICWPHGA